MFSQREKLVLSRKCTASLQKCQSYYLGRLLLLPGTEVAQTWHTYNTEQYIQSPYILNNINLCNIGMAEMFVLK